MTEHELMAPGYVLMGIGSIDGRWGPEVEV